ncbi:hypothetical protein BKA58DRAFT_402010 [Alternaria rosae]|uniref:uncharacterized protein n=1 Tax=Alternaria rosae TaxID=1187941 RepID=UPI001E8E2A49|nr:uncharacterized protein BKA58DRAFT_402010 [Alternaria rosae]KAH6870482.1 hypothetical protein BKA58DRAFT_402010 [Alternaria rosae]
MSPARLISNGLSTCLNGAMGPCKAEAAFTGKQMLLTSWEGHEMIDTPEQFVVELSIREVREIEAAAREFAASGRPVAEVSPAVFPLPEVGPKLFRLQKELYEGKGFFVLRGLEPSRYEGERNILIFAGIASYVGDRRGLQYKGGPALTHVIDLSSNQPMAVDQVVPQANRNVALPFHSDNCHILALYSLHSACKGGRSKLASVRPVYDILAARHPKVLELLKKDWEWDSCDTDCEPFRRPLLFEADGNIILNYARRYFLGSPGYPRNPSVAAISDEQLLALNVLDRVASEVALTFRFETGDVQFLNNLGILHARESFVNSDLTGCRRHLLRMYLHDSVNGWSVPPELRGMMKDLYDHDQKAQKLPWTLSALPYVASP